MHDKMSGLPGKIEELLRFPKELLEFTALVSFQVACKFSVPYKPFGVVAKLSVTDFGNRTNVLPIIPTL